jgi:hypothetical protein
LLAIDHLILLVPALRSSLFAFHQSFPEHDNQTAKSE